MSMFEIIATAIIATLGTVLGIYVIFYANNDYAPVRRSCPSCGSKMDEKVTEPIEPKHGHWIIHISELYPLDSTMECDQCHHEQTIFMVDNNYCPNCGAEMKEELL